MFAGDNEYISLLVPGVCQEQRGYVIGNMGKGQLVKPQMPGQDIWTLQACGLQMQGARQ